MKVAVSGSAGFVGQNVCRLLRQEGHEVYEIDIVTGFDLCNKEVVAQIPHIDSFIHLANLVYVPASYQEPEKFYRVNYLTTLNALEVCRKFKSRMIYVSSYVYGTPRFLPVSEDHPVCPFNPYAQTKVICEFLCEGYHRDFGVNISVIRPFNLYGAGQTGRLLIPEIFSQIKNGDKIIKLKASSPRRDYVNVKDFAKALVACIDDRTGYSIYNVCSGSSVSVLEITEIINKYLKNKVQFEFSDSDRPNEVDETLGSYEKLKGHLGWTPSMSFDEGIKEIIESEGLGI